jgi:signal transduction histidine kinase
MSLLATEFSSFAKLPASRFTRIDAIEVLQSVILLYQGDPAVDIVLRNEAGNSRVMLDRDQLMRVFNNLIKNATQAIPPDRKGYIEVHCSEKKNRLIISIRDNGTGIPEEEQSKIFLPNFSTKTSGMGLGLAIVKNIIENGGGSIYFETKPDAGTVFYVSLPLHNE